MEQFAILDYVKRIQMLIDNTVIFYMLNYKANIVILFKTQATQRNMCNNIDFRTALSNDV